MNISVCITVKDEAAGTILKLLDSIVNQSKHPNEVIIIDASPAANFQLPIYNKFSKYKFKIINEPNIPRSKARNFAIELSRNEIIAITDAGCVAHPDWLEKITEPFENEEVDVVAGFYYMSYKNNFEKAESIFLGITPEKFDVSFLPSTRSIAFRKEIWEEVGGYPESLNDTAEDTVFNYRLLKNSVKIARVKDAIVEWGMPATLRDFFWKVFNYAKGDAQTRIFNYPTKGIMSHNIKALFIIFRYIIGLILLIISLYNTSLLPLLLFLILIYVVWAYRKAGLWGIVLQFVSDFAVMNGFVVGLIK